ncbi:hypothetical protein B0H17DRAFT_1141008 [Mycena rosella]|uniref:Uncharacterized protein n=1 Tax=Mycena rosella TaxID=1033263 RepID=A0AAD7D0K3_MYCRO|nr:hypothetical protein B0H17DRAFT_1141008 [Mycena rosella]
MYNLIMGQWGTFTKGSFQTAMKFYPLADYNGSFSLQGQHIYGEMRYICTTSNVTGAASNFGLKAYHATWLGLESIPEFQRLQFYWNFPYILGPKFASATTWGRKQISTTDGTIIAGVTVLVLGFIRMLQRILKRSWDIARSRSRVEAGQQTGLVPLESASTSSTSLGNVDGKDTHELMNVYIGQFDLFGNGTNSDPSDISRTPERLLRRTAANGKRRVYVWLVPVPASESMLILDLRPACRLRKKLTQSLQTENRALVSVDSATLPMDANAMNRRVQGWYKSVHAVVPDACHVSFDFQDGRPMDPYETVPYSARHYVLHRVNAFGLYILPAAVGRLSGIDVDALA